MPGTKKNSDVSVKVMQKIGIKTKINWWRFIHYPNGPQGFENFDISSIFKEFRIFKTIQWNFINAWNFSLTIHKIFNYLLFKLSENFSKHSIELHFPWISIYVSVAKNDNGQKTQWMC